MATKEYALVPLFEKFIRYSYKGKRLKPDGNRIKPQTVDNYVYVLQYLREYELHYEIVLRIKVMSSHNRRLLLAERKYWKNFYLKFTNYLYFKKNCYDNYVGTVIKIIRNFFSFLNSELDIVTGGYYKGFYVCKEEIPVVTLMPQQLNFLITNLDFEESLSRPLKKAKDIFVMGCTIALRVSDLFAIKFTDVEQVGPHYYIQVRTIKTGTFVRIKLPAYAIAIIKKFESRAKGRQTVFPPVPRTRFNNQLKAIAGLAGWTNVVKRERSKRGIYDISLGRASTAPCRFCDMISSHIMRRTAITTMLMLGMKEPAVRKISGHTDNSKYFYRYVNLVQSYLDNEVDVVFEKLVEMEFA
jgi:integrase